MTDKIVPDTSIVIDGKMTELAEKGDIDGEVIIPEFVVDELESQANKGFETGYTGIEEIKSLRQLSDRKDFEVTFTGRLPSGEEIELADAGRIDALIRMVAEEEDAVLYTADNVQGRIARAKGIEHKLFEKEHVAEFPLKEYFDEETMSVHLKQGSTPKAKRGLPGEFELEEIGEEELSRDEINRLIQETIEAAEVSDEGLIEMEREGATVIQLGRYRIAIARPPFSEAPEITAVRPVSKVSLEDYDLSEKLKERLEEKAEGILIAGSPGHGKSTFAQALAEHYKDQGHVIKTMEKPRDLDVGPDVTQYAELEEEMENTGDFLLLVRPDYTIYDEVRKTADFEVYSDMRMAGVGMVGVVHAAEGVDAVQRLIGRVELGMIPQVCDTVIHIENAEVAKVYRLQLTVKVPEGMTEADLARPVVQILDLETDEPEYEIYTYGEETVVIPAEGGDDETGAKKLARQQIEHMLKGRVDTPEIEFISDDHIRLMVDEDDIPHVIGTGGENIEKLENELELDITVEPRSGTLKGEIDHEVEERGNSVIIEVGEDYSGQEVDVYARDKFLFAATVGKSGEISVTKQSDLAGQILGAAESGELNVRA
ncbi:MAG: PINc/VapC family ATPase [Candidatus Nanohaloarchaea archaeon]